MSDPNPVKGPTTDAWGIDKTYKDALGDTHETSEETRKAILASMGAEGDLPPNGSSVLMVDPRSPLCLVEPGVLILESGEKVTVRSELPRELPFGYHRLLSEQDGSVSHVICGPGECYLPDALHTWGWAVQLYGLRSRSSWGIGDLSDLRNFGRWTAKDLHAGMVLVNPLSAAAPVSQQQSSPYYPSTRRYRNPLFLRIEEVAGAADAHVDLEHLAATGRALNEDRRIDRNSVFRLKMEALRLLWQRFSDDTAFAEYCAREGQELEVYARFCALAEHYDAGWHKWPEEYRHPDLPAVRKFATEQQDRVRFHCWVQWLLDQQLERASQAVPIVQDLPIGSDPSGADAWAWQDLLAKKIAVGAPPDEFNTGGQNWGLPPFVSYKVRQAGYRPFIETIRATLRHAGGLRIDHVMGLFRLFWIPEGFGAGQGAYVRYRADELLSIVALESWRAKAFVVGEDLGTIEAGVREMLQAHKILSYRLLWFEKDPPKTYPEMALAAVTTHDLPTIAGLWTGMDLEAQTSIGLKPNVEAVNASRERLRTSIGADENTPLIKVMVDTHRLLAEAPSRILTAALDDALLVEERPNMPATVNEWPNWSIALPKPLEQIQEEPLVRHVAQALNRAAHTKDGTD